MSLLTDSWCKHRQGSPRLTSFRDHDYNDRTGEFAVLNIILSKLSLLPVRRDDENILVTEGDMVRQRHERFVEFLVTKGKGRNNMSSEERVESDQRTRQVTLALSSSK